LRKLILLLVILAVIAAGWFLYFNDTETAVKVDVTAVRRADLENALEFTGEVTPGRMYRVMSAKGGEIKKLIVSEGARVQAGDALIALNTAEIDVQIEKAELNLARLQNAQAVTASAGAGEPLQTAMAEEKAKIALALSQTTGFDYASLNQAFGEEAAAQIGQNAAAMAASLADMQMSEAEAAFFPGEAETAAQGGDVALAELTLQALKSAREEMLIKSEIAGTVIALNVHRGEVLAPGVPAMVIADIDETRITAYVYEKDVAAIGEGMSVQVGDCGNGLIESIGEAASGMDGTQAAGTVTKVKIVPPEGFNRMPGAMVDLKLRLSFKDDALSLPTDCVTDDGCVYVVGEDGTLEKRRVATGFEDTWDVEILEGVLEGELVVVSPGSVEEGQQVAYDRSE